MTDDHPLTDATDDYPVLIVDDAGSIRSYHRAILTDAGFTVHEAANGYEALERCLAEAFHLLVVDVNMPVMDGYSLVSTVRREALVPDVPIIMVSSEGEAGDHAEAYRCGANLYLVKPADPGQLALAARILTGRIRTAHVVAAGTGAGS